MGSNFKREDEGKVEMAEGVEYFVGFGGVETGVFFGDKECGAETEADGFAVQHFSVGEGGLDAVTDGVAEVKKCADIFCFGFVLFDDAGFDCDIFCEDFGWDLAGGGIERG